MNKYIIEKDITCICVTAKSFPEGVVEAFQILNEYVNESDNRKLFGITYFENGAMVYKAACTQLEENEAEIRQTETYTIKAGTYIFEEINNWMQHREEFPKSFARLANQGNRTDKVGIELYEGYDVKCMLRLMP